jgi:hypothetical protein
MEQVIIGVDPHKLSATIEVVDVHGRLLGSGRYTTDKAGYAAMRAYAKNWTARTWAIEGANGAGRPLTQRLVEAGEQVLDVPAAARRGRSTPDTTARPTPLMPTPSPWSPCARKGCGSLPLMANSKRCGCSPTARRVGPATGTDGQPTPATAQRTDPRTPQAGPVGLASQGITGHRQARDLPGRPGVGSRPTSWPTWSPSMRS